MALADLVDWMDTFTPDNSVWFLKRLSANDTLASGGHQAGPYIPKPFLFNVLPEINKPEQKNPDIEFDLFIDSHSDYRKIRAVWYNNKLLEGHLDPKKRRDEARLTRFGGQESALLNPDSTGSLTVFAFTRNSKGRPECHVWVCDHETQEELIEERVGPVEPGAYLVWPLDSEAGLSKARTNCYLEEAEIPQEWLIKFPTGEDIIGKAMSMRELSGQTPDIRLLRRRICEFEIFQSVEQAYWMPKISVGFSSIDDFTALAQSILQSRKSRSGKSLELHARNIFLEEQLTASQDFEHNPVIENGKRPDFLFPNRAAYENRDFPASKLRMLAVKTTCKDRWRQVLNEADRIETKHLLTLQEGVSDSQFKEMCEANISLVVPAGLHEKYPKSVQPHLITLESFIGDIRLLKYSA